MDPNGSQWISIDAKVSKWIQMDPNGSKLIQMDSISITWKSSALLGSSSKLNINLDSDISAQIKEEN